MLAVDAVFTLAETIGSSSRIGVVDEVLLENPFLSFLALSWSFEGDEVGGLRRPRRGVDKPRAVGIDANPIQTEKTAIIVRFAIVQVGRMTRCKVRGRVCSIYVVSNADNALSCAVWRSS